MERTERKWALEPHLCADCGGRILRCVEGNGITPGGNPVRRCADCGKSGTEMGADAICWCGVSHRGNNERAYRCLPFSILETEPWLEEAFRACGCDPKRGDVGIVLQADINRLRTKPPNKSGEERTAELLKPVYDALARAVSLNGRDRTDALNGLKTRIDLLGMSIRSLLS